MADLPDPDLSQGAAVPADARGESARVEALVALAHEHARRTHVSLTELAALKWQQQHDPEAVRLRAELAAVSAELERLRALPELRVGQRVRQTTSFLRRSAARQPSELAVPARVDADGSNSASNSTAGALAHPPLPSPSVVLVVRNRPASLQLVLDWLERHDVDDVEIVDNASSDPTLLARFRALDAPVTRVPVDLGPSAAWASGVLSRRNLEGNVLVIDIDGQGVTLPDVACPSDVVDRMTHELTRRSDLDAVELSPSSDQDLGRFRLIRRDLHSAPTNVGRLESPYCSATTIPDLSDPSKRYAALHDQRALDGDR